MTIDLKELYKFLESAFNPEGDIHFLATTEA